MKLKLILSIVVITIFVAIACGLYMMKKESQRIHKHHIEMTLKAMMPDTWDKLHTKLSADSLLDSNKKLELYLINRKMEKNHDNVEQSPYYQILWERYTDTLGYYD